jgi:hypothetical protein
LILIGAIVLGCGLVLKPFASAILWAAILCFATWPLHELLLKWFHGRRNLVAIMMLKGVSMTEPDPSAEFQDSRAVYHDDLHGYATNEPTMDGPDGGDLLADDQQVRLTVHLIGRINHPATLYQRLLCHGPIVYRPQRQRQTQKTA